MQLGNQQAEMRKNSRDETLLGGNNADEEKNDQNIAMDTEKQNRREAFENDLSEACLLYTSDAADE